MGCSESAPVSDAYVPSANIINCYPAGWEEEVRLRTQAYEELKKNLETENDRLTLDFQKRWFSMEFKNESNDLNNNNASDQKSLLRRKLEECQASPGSVEDVLQFFKSIGGLEICEPQIISLGIDWITLKELNDDDLKNELKIESGIKRKQLMIKIEATEGENERKFVIGAKSTMDAYIQDLARFLSLWATGACMFLMSPET